MKLCLTKVLGDVRAAFLSKPKEPGMSIHLLQRITDVTRRSRWAHFAETTDLHLADLRRQAEEHHRDRKPAPFLGDNSSGDRSTLCPEYDSVPRACTSHETSTPILPCYHDTDIHNRVPRFPEVLFVI